MARLAASSMVTPQYRPSLARRVGASLVLLVAALVLTVAPVLAKNVLSSAVVSPRTGTTATLFVFSVHYAGKPATSVVARVGTLTVALSLVSGTSSTGTAAGGAADQSGPLLPAIVLGLFVILGVGGIALLTGRRQAEERPSPESHGPPDAPPSPAFVRRAAATGAAGADTARSRPRAAWEAYSSLENQPLGSVDELPPEEQLDADEP